jgi:hypothetical protein
MRQVNAFQDQGQFRRLQLGPRPPRRLERRQPEHPLLESLVVQTQPAAVPQQDLRPVAPPIEEDEQVTREWTLNCFTASERFGGFEFGMVLGVG